MKSTNTFILSKICCIINRLHQSIADTDYIYYFFTNKRLKQQVVINKCDEHINNILYLSKNDLNLVHVVISTDNIIHWPCHKYLDLHYSLTVAVRYHIDLFPRLDVELFSPTRGSTQIYCSFLTTSTYFKFVFNLQI